MSELTRDAVNGLNAGLARAFAAGDAAAITRTFAEDAWLVPSNRPPIDGRMDIADFWREAAGWGNWLFTFLSREVNASGPLAVEFGKYTLRFVAGPSAPRGLGSFEERGNYVSHWRREDDGAWRLAIQALVSESPVRR